MNFYKQTKDLSLIYYFLTLWGDSEFGLLSLPLADHLTLLKNLEKSVMGGSYEVILICFKGKKINVF